MRGFVIQQRAILHDIWFEPDSEWSGPKITRSTTVSELRDALERYADTTTLSFRQHFRIITQGDGDPVARFVVRPGRIHHARRRY